MIKEKGEKKEKKFKKNEEKIQKLFPKQFEFSRPNNEMNWSVFQII